MTGFNLNQLQLATAELASSQMSYQQQRCLLTCVGPQGLSTLSSLTGLNRLELWGVQLPIDAVSGIAALTHLEELDLAISGNWTPADEAYISMMQLTHMTRLSSLTFFATVNGRAFRQDMVSGLAK